MRRAQPSEVDAERCRALLDAYLSPHLDEIYLQSIKKAETLDTLGFTRRVWEQREEPRRPATSAAACRAEPSALPPLKAPAPNAALKLFGGGGGKNKLGGFGAPAGAPMASWKKAQAVKLGVRVTRRWKEHMRRSMDLKAALNSDKASSKRNIKRKSPITVGGGPPRRSPRTVGAGPSDGGSQTARLASEPPKIVGGDGDGSQTARAHAALVGRAAGKPAPPPTGDVLNMRGRGGSMMMRSSGPPAAEPPAARAVSRHERLRATTAQAVPRPQTQPSISVGGNLRREAQPPQKAWRANSPRNGAMAAAAPPQQQSTLQSPRSGNRSAPYRAAVSDQQQAQYEVTIAVEEAKFDNRSKKVMEELKRRLKKRPNSPRLQDQILKAHMDTYMNRVNAPPKPVPEDKPMEWKRVYPKVVPPPPPPPKFEPPPPPPKKDIWQPRATWCDSKSLFDTDGCEARRFQIDWESALDLGLRKMIMKRDDDAGEDEDGDGECDEVDDVKAVLWDCHDMLTQIFDFYACSSGKLGEISLNQWNEFIEDMDIEDEKHCRQADMDTLFIAVNTASKLRDKERMKKGGPQPFIRDSEKSLNRVEFIYCIVSVAISRYVLSGQIKDVSEALHTLLVEWMEPRCDKAVFSDYNAFREKMYKPAVTSVLADYEPSLKHLFAVAAGGGAETGGKGAELLSLPEWSSLLRALGLIGVDVTERDARLCFSCSRMVVVDGRTTKGNAKENNLPFEGFLEGLCRLSMLKALPTDEELKLTQCSDAGVFMQRLHMGSLPESFTDTFDISSCSEASAFMQMRAANWGEPSVHALDDAMRHLIACIIRTVEEDSTGADNMALTLTEVKNWAKFNLKEAKQ